MTLRYPFLHNYQESAVHSTFVDQEKTDLQQQSGELVLNLLAIMINEGSPEPRMIPVQAALY